MGFFRLYFLYLYFELGYDERKGEYGNTLRSFMGGSFVLFATPCMALSYVFFEFLFPGALSIVVFENYKGELSVATLVGVLLSFVPMYYLKPRDLTFQEIEKTVRSHWFFERRSVIKIIAIPVTELIIIVCIISN